MEHVIDGLLDWLTDFHYAQHTYHFACSIGKSMMRTTTENFLFRKQKFSKGNIIHVVHLFNFA